MMILAVHVTGFPESYAEDFLKQVLKSIGATMSSDPIRMSKGRHPSNAEYAALFMMPVIDLNGFSKLLASRLRSFMTSRGNKQDDGSYSVTVAHLNDPLKGDDRPEVDHYDEALHGYL